MRHPRAHSERLKRGIVIRVLALFLLPLVQLPAALRRFTCGTPAEVRVLARDPRNVGR